MWGDTEKVVQIFGLIEGNGSVHKDVKAITLAAVTGEGFSLSLINPIEPSSNNEGATDTNRPKP
jgi:hypothetical protein